MSAKRRQDAITKFSVPLEAQNGGPTILDDNSYAMADDDDDFIDEDDERAFGKNSERKGKGKARDTRYGSADGDENPRVMLLSLKAVCYLGIITIS